MGLIIGESWSAAQLLLIREGKDGGGGEEKVWVADFFFLSKCGEVAPERFELEGSAAVD